MSALQNGNDGMGVEIVHGEIRDRILQGSMRPGEEISQVKLADSLGVSRTPLREALRLLQREGLVTAEANRQYQVAELSLPDMEELYIARIVLEAAGIRISTARVSAEDIAELEAEMARMAHFAELEDYERWEVPHRAFHHRLIVHAGARVVGLLEELSTHAERYRRFYTVEAPRAWSAGVTEHRGILDAVKAGDADAAAARLVEHLCHTVLGVAEMVDPDYDTSRLRIAMAMASAPVASDR